MSFGESVIFQGLNRILRNYQANQAQECFERILAQLHEVYSRRLEKNQHSKGGHVASCQVADRPPELAAGQVGPHVSLTF
jgi:hypothetical protein